ncbi:MAG: glycosyltransferase family 2 protein [Desulfobacterales bacterium]|nr:glycosyltransferase family 2 protein [Desulfobacterales bacterium]MBS3755978.1 glycosyltransferase family 2 protein [Desulfobacterales bacterium]
MHKPRAADNPLISVVIPVLDRQDWIAEAVDSVLLQDYAPFELIVVDDGSTDQTPEILSTYGDAIRVFNQVNAGVSAARNRGAAAARGEWIAFLDSDDYWLPGKLAAQMRFFRDNPEIAICQTEEYWIRRGTRVNPGRRHKKQAGRIFAPSLELCLISPSAAMMHKSLLAEEGGFNENLPACEDYDLWLKITCSHPVGLIREPFIVKRGGHPDQLSARPGLDRYRIESIAGIMASGRLNPDQYRAAARVLKEKCEIYAAGCEKRGKTSEAARYKELGVSFALREETRNPKHEIRNKN